MTEVPDKQTEGTGLAAAAVGTAGAAGADERGRGAAGSRSRRPRRCSRRRRRWRSGAGLIVLPGEKLSRGRESRGRRRAGPDEESSMLGRAEVEVPRRASAPTPRASR